MIPSPAEHEADPIRGREQTGKIVKDARIKVALLTTKKTPAETAKRISQRFNRHSEEDPGWFEMETFEDPGSCREAIARRKITALCIWFRALPPRDFVAMIDDIRVTRPLVSICLVGTQQDLDEMPGLDEAWRDRFSHYYRITENTKDEDFDDNVGVVRDLLLADAIKAKALGHLETAPGRILRIRHGPPFGFWITPVATVLAAILGSIIAPMLTHFFTSPKP